MAGGAFDGGPAIPAEHNPLISGLTQQIRVDPADLEKIALQWASSVEKVVLQTVISAIKQATGVDLSTIFNGIDLTNPGAIALAIESAIQAVITGMVQQVIDGIVNGLGVGSTGNDVTAIPRALLGIAEQLPIQFITQFGQLFAGLAGLQSQVTAIQNTPGTILNYDFAVATTALTGFVNLAGVIARSPSGPYLQTPAQAVARLPTAPATNKHGATITVAGKMQGTCSVAICSDTGATNYASLDIYAGFDGDAVRLMTGASPTLAVVQKQIDFTGTNRLQNTNTFDIWYDPATNTFNVNWNGQQIMQWVDTTNIVSHGPTKLNILIGTNGSNRNENGFYGFGISKVTAYDRQQ